VFETFIVKRLEIGDSGARFQVDASFQTGKSDWMLAGTAPLLASRLPVQVAHHRM
jgi:hypothetical protein